MTTEWNVDGTVRRDDKQAILLAALLSEYDYREAGILWERLAPAQFSSILTSDSFYTYDIQLMQWRGSGRPVAQDRLRAAVLAFIGGAEHEASKITILMLGGTIVLDEWYRQMLSMNKRVIVAVSAVARGGLERLSEQERATASAVPEQLDPIGDAIDDITYQHGRLARFAEAIEKRTYEVSTTNKVERRARLYPKLGFPIYQKARRREAKAVGVEEERNILSDGEHCFSAKGDPLVDCPSLTSAGWQPIGVMPPPGLRKCSMNCQCHLEFRRDGQIIE